MTEASVTRGPDGCYHPANEEEIVALVRRARREGKQLRVFGSSHSVFRAIVTDHFAGARTPEGELQLVLDRYTAISPPVPDPDVPGAMRVEVQAGCHLGLSPHRPVQGRMAPGGARASDVRAASPWHDGAWERSLNYQLHHRYGLALPDLGGITHQTVSGFLATGSSGGTTKWSAHDAIVAIRIVDGEGEVHVLERGGEDADYFRAAGVSLGLLGVVSTITFRCEPRYDVVGTETISETRKSDRLDFYGDRPGSGLPELDRYLVETDYARLMWWPQYDFDRLVVWEARRAPYDADRAIRPYKEIASFPVLSQVAASVLYTVLGNLETPERLPELLAGVRAHPDAAAAAKELSARRARLAPPIDPGFPAEPQELLPWLSALVERLRKERHDPVTLGAAWVAVVELLVVIADELLVELMRLPGVRQLFALLGRVVPEHIGTILGLFVPTGEDGAPKTQHFADRWFLGLPMDNQMDDLLMPTWFTELWIPFEVGDGTVKAAIAALRRHFDADGTARGAYAKTGPFSFELYAARADETFFLSPSAGKKHVFRVDVFWFARNQGDPVTDFYPAFWDVLAPFDYRLHWGKFLPTPDPSEPDRLTKAYPDFARFEAVRRRADPGGLFATRYFRDHLGLDREPAPPASPSRAGGAKKRREGEGVG